MKTRDVLEAEDKVKQIDEWGLLNSFKYILSASGLHEDVPEAVENNQSHSEV